jgi:hypothetical protein
MQLSLVPFSFVCNTLYIWNDTICRFCPEELCDISLCSRTYYTIYRIVGCKMALPAVVIPPVLVHAIIILAPFIPLPPDVVHVLEPGWLDMLVSLPLAMLAGAIGAYIGTVLGDVWHWNKQ